MNREQKENLIKLKYSVMKLFHSKCYICHIKPVSFVYHHLWYLPTDRIYSDFKDDKGNPDTLAYHEYLIPIIKQNPGRFMLLCNGHHVILERMKRWESKKFDRLVRAVRLSKPKQKKITEYRS